MIYFLQKKNAGYKAISSLRAYIGKLISNVSAKKLFSEIPIVYFYPEIERCLKCSTKLKVLKTLEKAIVTLDIGTFRARETILQCPNDKSIYTSKLLRNLTPFRCTFGFDVMVYVGKALFIRSRNEQEIIKELAEKNISISDREISYLGKKFIIYLALAHRESRVKLRKSMSTNGGYILHLDGTCEDDSPHLFTGIDGITEIILDNIKLPSEKADLIIPFLRKIKYQYGSPIALVHDMGKGIMKAVTKVFPDIPDFICHFHFLRDIGKDLLEEEYKKIRNCLKKYKIRTLLRQKAKVFENKINADDNMVQDLKISIIAGEIENLSLKKISTVSAYALIHWAFDISEQLEGYGFPFDRAHLIFYQRLKVLHSALKQIVEIKQRSKRNGNGPFYRIWRLLNHIINDRELKQSVISMEEKVEVFDKLRRSLSIALPEGKKGLNDDGRDANIKSIEEKVKGFRSWITTDKRYLKRKDYQNMVKQIDKYWKKLFADPININTSNGQIIIQPQRTNNILERFFRDLKRRYRKKSGTNSLNKTLKTILSDTPLVRNIENDDYLKIILNGCNTLEERFAQIQSKLVIKELKSAQQNVEKISPTMKKIIKLPKLPQTIVRLVKAYAK